jgi:hypothetical protein
MIPGVKNPTNFQGFSIIRQVYAGREGKSPAWE